MNPCNVVPGWLLCRALQREAVKDIWQQYCSNGDSPKEQLATCCLANILLRLLPPVVDRLRLSFSAACVGVQLTGIGVDELVKHGMLDKCKEGPLYWLDTADSQPCIGTGGIAAWQLTAHGELLVLL